VVEASDKFDDEGIVVEASDKFDDEGIVVEASDKFEDQSLKVDPVTARECPQHQLITCHPFLKG
jgi:hypothetical protein